MEVESTRRRSTEKVERRLLQSGFTNVTTHSIWETRRQYAGFAGLAIDLRAGTGRSILNELTDEEIQDLTEAIGKQLPKNQQIVAKDRWTIWYAEKAT